MRNAVAQLDLLSQQREAAPECAPVHRGRSRVLAVVPTLPARGMDTAAWVRSLLDEYQNANDSARRAKHYAHRPTTHRGEAGNHVEQYQRHLVRMERVVLALTDAVRHGR